jgi:hypothetical protein
VVLAAGGLEHVAHAESELASLERALPAGWTMLETDSELVIRHDRPCYRGTEHVPNEPDPAVLKKTGARSKGDGTLLNLELRYTLEARWTAQQFADAKKTNDAIAAEVKAAHDRYKIDAIKVAKGTYLPANADERTRLAAFTRAESAATARRVHEPMCSVGDISIFDGDETYAPLRLEIDPPEAAKEAFAIVDLVKKHCGAK